MSSAASPYPSHGSLKRSHTPNGELLHGLSPHDTAAQATAVAALQDATASASGSQSPPEVPTSAVKLNDGRKRRASGQPGGRGVANLTPEQLAKKRANDREAQRAIRERTKTTIETLERRIRELESQQPFQELQRAMQERDRAVHEAVELRQKLSQITNVINQPFYPQNTSGGQSNGMGGGGGYYGTPTSAPHAVQYQHAQQQHSQQPGSLNGTFTFDDLIDPNLLTREAGDTELAALTAQQSPLPPIQQQQQPQQYQSPTTSTTGHEHHPQQTTGGAGDSRSSTNYTTTQGSPVSSTTPGATAGGAQQHYPQHTPQSSHQYSSPQPNGVHHDTARSAPASSLHRQHSGERLGVDFLLESKQRESNSSTPLNARTNVPAYTRLPKNCDPTSPLDALLKDFVNSRRSLLASGAPMSEVLGPDYPCFAILADPNSEERKHCHPISTVLVDIISTFPDISGLAERVATLYFMFLLLRWLICPEPKHFDRLPEWLHPVAEQVQPDGESGGGGGHAVWIDHVPWYVPDTIDSFFGSEADDAMVNFDLLDSSSFSSDSTGDGSTSVAVVAVYIAEMLTGNLDRPSMRALLCTTNPKRFTEFFVPFSTTVSVNWPASSSANGEPVLLSVSPDEQKETHFPITLKMNPTFEKHMRDLRSWSLGPKFASAFPDLCAEDVRIEG